MNQIQNISFHGQTVPVFTQNNQHYVAMKPICENIGLDWVSQHKKIQRNTILNSGMVIMTIPATDGKSYETTCLPIEYLNGWLFGIDVNRVKPEIRDNLLRYQRECFKVLNAHFNKPLPQRPALPTPANMEANREMFDIIASIENTLAKAYCGPSLNDQIRALTGKRRFDLDFYQLAALIRKLVEMMPQQIMEKHPEIRRLKNAEKYSFNRPAGLPPQPAKPAAKPAEPAHPDRDALYHGCRSHIGALLLHPSGKTKQDKEQIIQAALDEMDNILHVVVTAAENYDYNEENRNLGKSELTTAVYELTKLQRLINDCARSW